MANLVLGVTNSTKAPTTLSSFGKQQFAGQYHVLSNGGGTAIVGSSPKSTGGVGAIGVLGEALGPNSQGVFGQADGVGVFGLGLSNAGTHAIGVFGEGEIGVLGRGDLIGVEAECFSDTGIALVARATVTAGTFVGNVVVQGALQVTGPKSAVVPHPDGSHRTLYAVESPESWFEDYGRARLSGGRARVVLARDFAALVRLDDYYVFLTAEGDCATLFVTKRSRRGFEVRESAGGASNAPFSYRIIAKRKDIAGARLAKVVLPKSAPAPKKAAAKQAARRRRKR